MRSWQFTFLYEKTLNLNEKPSPKLIDEGVELTNYQQHSPIISPTTTSFPLFIHSFIPPE